MPRLSVDTLLQRAIEPAAMDRDSLADAYRGTGGHEADEARREAAAIRALKDRPFASLSDGEQDTARTAFLYAEQWEYSLGLTVTLKTERKACSARARLYREQRHRLWGKNMLEHAIESATAVPVKELFDRLEQQTSRENTQ